MPALVRYIGRLSESVTLIECILFIYFIAGNTARLLGRHEMAWRLLSQVHRSTRRRCLKEAIEPFVMATLPLQWSRPSFFGPVEKGLEKLIGTRLMVLKEPRGKNEPGILNVMFSDTITILPKTFDLARLLADFRLVLEPSWSGYCASSILQYSKYDVPVYVLAPEEDDYRFLKSISTNLFPIQLGNCDWVNPEVAQPFLHSEKRYDIVMNSNWASWKRHHVLFRALAKMSTPYRVALIGVPWENRTRGDILGLARDFGVDSQIDIFESISYSRVMEVTSCSKVSILLSLKEGSNRAIAESMFCNVPVIVLSEHVGGILKSVNRQTGRIVPERQFPECLADMINNYDKFDPREWAIDNISCFKSTQILNNFLKANETEIGAEWTVDIVTHANSPESKYVPEEISQNFAKWNRALTKYFA